MAMSDFQREYAAARRRYLAGQGPATFTFGNKSFSVASKEESDTARALERAASEESGRFRSRRADDDSMRFRGPRSYVAQAVEPSGPTEEQLAQYREMSRPGRDAIEPIMPEAALIGSAGGLAALRGALARRSAAKQVSRPGRIEPTMRGDEAPLSGRIEPEFKRGGKTKSYAKGGVTRADGCVTKGHTKGTMR